MKYGLWIDNVSVKLKILFLFKKSDFWKIYKLTLIVKVEEEAH